ncbi:RING-H2 finger protein ATL74-like [Phragmites australis]|uniref:RING-H2 finger protein ATL74-like n=1 Tax=Phragmites australis TaxID=29695 RepID=UPI002D78297A|nr:RING-H2 finger protein ATL74-like [Phragmites australis]
MDHRDSEAPAASAAAVGRVVKGTGDGGAASFDTNMVIILAALFFALLFAIGLNSLARCALRCGGRGAADGGEGETAGGASCVGGIRKRALRSIPVEVYGGGEGAKAEEDVCAICLGEFADGEKVRVLPRCRHGFHVRCVDAWLVSRGSCPTCRRPVMDGKPAKGSGVGQSRRPDSDTIAVVIA